jgi:hypothetical protein
MRRIEVMVLATSSSTERRMPLAEIPGMEVQLYFPDTHHSFFQTTTTERVNWERLETKSCQEVHLVSHIVR